MAYCVGYYGLFRLLNGISAYHQGYQQMVMGAAGLMFLHDRTSTACIRRLYNLMGFCANSWLLLFANGWIGL